MCIGGVCLPVLSPECLQQRLGLLQVGRVKALGKPPVDGCKQFAGLGPLALMLPQAAQAQSRPQLERFRLLTSGRREGLLKSGFRLCRCPMAAGRWQPADP